MVLDEWALQIERVVKRDNQNKKALVSWSGFPNKFNSWISFKDLENI